MSKKLKITLYVLIIVMIAAILAAGVIMVAKVISDLSRENTVLEQEGTELESSLSKLQREKAALEADIEKLLGEIAVLEANLADSGTYFADEIAALKKSVSEKEAAIATLEADIARYQTVFTIDVRAQARLIDEIVEYIETSAPYVLMPIAEIEDEGDFTESTLGETAKESDVDAAKDEESDDEEEDVFLYTPEGEEEPLKCKWVAVTELMKIERESIGDDPLFTSEELEASGLTEEDLTNKILRERVFAREDVFYPSVSVYYEDLLTGYHFDYDAEKIYDAASVIKAPYILSVLKVISADEKAFFEKIENIEGFVPEMIDTDEDGIPDKTVIEYSDTNYDLSDVVVYDSESMLKEGSGKIKDMEDGTEFTYIDFIKYTLEYSDNVAYSQLRERFGFDTMRELARKLKASSVLKGGNSMSATDAGKLFKAIYEFSCEDERYGTLMRESMLKGNHRVVIPSGVYPTAVMHKYGWDEAAYHDAGIVLYDDKPYVLAVFSNMDNGGGEVNTYLQNIVKMINKLHKGFYGN